MSAAPYQYIRMGLLAPLTLVSCLQSAASQPCAVPSPSPGVVVDRRPWLDDYAALRAQLESSYANLTWFASPQGGLDLPELHARTLAALHSAPNAAAAEAAMDAFVSAFHDGHFSRLPRAEQLPSGPRPAQFFPARSVAPALGFFRTIEWLD